MLAWLLLPNGAPLGVIAYGVVLGGLGSLTAMGLVLVYRSSRVINFAQADVGGLSAGIAVVMVTGFGFPYFLALPLGLGAAVLTGWAIDVVVVRRFFNAPRLILTVATVGLAQLLGGFEVGLPSLFGQLKPLSTFKTPFGLHFGISPFVFGGDDLVAVISVAAVLIGLSWFFARSETGIGIRAAADSAERALLLGIPVRRLSTVTWMLAAGLSGVASMLTAPILGPNLGVISGPQSLLAPLAAAVVARMESLPVTVAASVGIGVFEQVVFWNFPRSSTVDVALFALIMVSLLFQRRRISRVDDSGLGGYIAQREIRPLSAAVLSRPDVRAARWVGWAVLGGLAMVMPLVLSDSKVTLLAYICIYGLLAVSLVVLTGWAGQISLGQFAFAGLGAGVTAALMVRGGADLFLALLCGAAVGALAAAVLGIPAVRIPGLFLAVATLAFGVPVNTFLLNSSYFPALTPAQLSRPTLLSRIPLDSPRSFYYLCLGVLAALVWMAANYRRSRAGRAALAVRDNERGASAFGIPAVRVKLTAFAFSGAIAALAGGLYVVGLRGMPFSGFNPESSLQIFTIVVIGGLGSLTGPLLGAAYVEGVEYFLHGAWQLLATGAGLLVLLMFVPGGLGEVYFAGRDRLLRALATRRGDGEEPAPAGAAGDEGRPDGAEREGVEREGVEREGVEREGVEREGVERDGPVPTAAGPALLECVDVDAGYGPVQVLFGVGVGVSEGEILALLGTNGAGKSTMLRVLAGLIRPSRGSVLLEGRDITALAPVERVKAGMVTVPGGRGVFGSLTVADNLRLATWLTRSDPDFVRSTRQVCFELFPVLGERLQTRASLLSGGEQQMLTLAQALLCRPRILMIDELSLGLAPSVVSVLLGAVRRINQDGATVVVVEQSLNVAADLAGRAVFMEKGQVRFSGPTGDLESRPDLLRSVFLGADRTASGPSSRRGPAPAASRRSAGRSTRNRPTSTSTSTSASASAPVRLSVEGMSRRFGGVTAVDDISFEVGAGEVVGIIGSNGAGKTTLFDLCSGFLDADRGRLVLDGTDMSRLPPAERAARGLGRLFQDARLFPSLTVTETIAAALERHVDVKDPLLCLFHTSAVIQSETEVMERVDELITTMGLDPYRQSFVSELSTGTRRVVELACAMAHRPGVLLLDEPSSGIAQRETEALGPLLIDLKETTGSSMVIIEHDIPLIAGVSDRLICLHLGQVLCQGRPEEVLSDPRVVASYLGTDPTTIARSGRAPKKSPISS